MRMVSRFTSTKPVRGTKLNDTIEESYDKSLGFLIKVLNHFSIPSM